MPKSFQQSIDQSMACKESNTIINAILNLIGTGISSNLSWALLTQQNQVCLDNSGPCLLLLWLLYWYLPDMKFASTWDLVEGSLFLVFS